MGYYWLMFLIRAAVATVSIWQFPPLMYILVALWVLDTPTTDIEARSNGS